MAKWASFRQVTSRFSEVQVACFGFTFCCFSLSILLSLFLCLQYVCFLCTQVLKSPTIKSSKEKKKKRGKGGGIVFTRADSESVLSAPRRPLRRLPRECSGFCRPRHSFPEPSGLRLSPALCFSRIRPSSERKGTSRSYSKIEEEEIRPTAHKKKRKKETKRKMSLTLSEG